VQELILDDDQELFGQPGRAGPAGGLLSGALAEEGPRRPLNTSEVWGAESTAFPLHE
jgi:hypothetical protein